MGVDKKKNINKLIAKVKKISNPQTKFGIYYELARLFIDNGDDPFKMLMESNKNHLLSLKNERQYIGKDLKVIILSKGCCKACDKLDRKRLSIEEALRKMPLPNPQCRHMIPDEKGNAFCHCSYVLEPIFKKKGCLGAIIFIISAIIFCLR